MNISVISENATLVEYLSKNPSLKVMHHYTSLSTQYDQFVSDLNRVDVLLLVDYSDLSAELSGLTKAIVSGNSYLFRADEIVLVTYSDYTNSPTKSAEDRFKAFVEMMRDNNYRVRVVQLGTIDFHSIYEGIIKETEMSDNDIRVYTKYKVSTSSGAVNLKAKKDLKRRLEPDKPDESSSLREQDAATKEMLRGREMSAPAKQAMIARVSDNLTVLSQVNRKMAPMILVSGLKYSGKSTFIIKALLELSSHGLPAIAIDSTGRSDYVRLQRFADSTFPVLRGSKIFEPTEDNVMVVELAHHAPTSSYINQLSGLVQGKTCIFEECEIDDIYNHCNTYDYEVTVVVVVEYDFTKLRDTTAILKTLEYPITVAVNARNSAASEESMESTIRDALPNVEKVIFFSDMVEAIMALEVC